MLTEQNRRLSLATPRHAVMRHTLAGSNHKTAALWNRALVLCLIRKDKNLSRRRISQITGLRGSTLTYIVRELIDKGVLRTAGKIDKKSVGQKQVLLNINPDLGYFLGITLRPRMAKIILENAAANRIGSLQLPISPPLETIPMQLRMGIEKWLAEIGTPAGKLLGMGVGVPGVVNSVDGVVLFSAPFDAHGVPLGALLEREFGSTVLVDHDACLGAIAESRGGAAKDVPSFVFFSINYNRSDSQILINSFGSALFLQGSIYRGAHYAAGELDSSLSPRRDILLDESELQLLSKTDGELTGALANLAKSVGARLASIFNFLDVQRAVIGGNCNISNTRFLAAIAGQTEKLLIDVPGRKTQVVASGMGADVMAQGAVIAASEAALEGGGVLAEMDAPLAVE